MDPVDIGIRLHIPIMEFISERVSSKEELTAIARMIDAFAGSLQIRAAERGLDGPADALRQIVKEKLQSLGLMSIKEQPVANNPPKYTSTETCFCVKDDDGECHSCRQEIASFGKEFAELQNTYIAKIDKIGPLSGRAPCSSCVLKYTDLAISGVFATIGKDFPASNQNVGLMMYSAFYQMLMGLGVEATPMLDKAWKELKELKGWI